MHFASFIFKLTNFFTWIRLKHLQSKVSFATECKIFIYYKLSCVVILAAKMLLFLFFFFFFFNIPHPNFTTSIVASAAIITHLPGFHGALPFHLETGYVTVDEEKGSEYFYYFVESERNPSEDPLLLWLIGGPYCSGFNAFAYSIGPVRLFSDSNNSSSLPNLAYNPYAWTKISSIIFLDWPIGTGFAFSKNAEAYTSDDLLSSKQIYIFIKKWFEVYPHFVSNSFFVGGDSYGGKLVPVVVQEIVQGNEGCKPQLVNIKGFLMGNPVIRGQLSQKSQVTQAHGLGIISDELLMMIENNCAGSDYGHPDDVRCSLNLGIFKEFLSEINEGNVLEPLCDKQPVRTKYSAELICMPSVTETMCAETPAVLANKWANNALTRKVLAIKEETVEKWLECRFDLNYTANIPSPAPFFCNLMARGYRALVYSGDHDLISPFVGMLEWINSLNFPILEEWRSWNVGGQVAGYKVLFSNNLTFATLKVSSIIFVDWPIGTGFAFSRNAEAYISDDLLSSKQIYIFIKKWFQVYPHFVSNPFFVGGDSYGGKLVPVVVHEIVQGNEGCEQQIVNIKGYLMGNPIMGREFSQKSQAHGLGIISDELFMMIENNCAGNDCGHPDEALCSSLLRIFQEEFLSEINEENVLYPLCNNQPVRAKELTEFSRFSTENSTELIYTPFITETVCKEDEQVLAKKWANNPLTRKVLEIKEETVEEWLSCKLAINYTVNIPSFAPLVFNLNTNGYRALFYSGDHDLLSPYVGTLKWIKSLEFSKLEEWRSWHVGGQVAGYTVLFSNNLTFATVKGGSHTPADHLPMQCFAMFQRWISDEVL